MNDCSIRITRRDGDVEHTVEIGCGAAWPIPLHEGPARLEWSDTLCDGERVNHAAAVNACATLGEGWRLPTRTELLSLVDDSVCGPSIDVEHFPDTQSAAYWTSTCVVPDWSFVWVVNFNHGLVNHHHRDDGGLVRAVRSVPAGQ